MKQEYLLGIDVGTSSVKAVLFDQNGVPQAEASASYGLVRSGACVEQDPDDYYLAVRKCVAGLLEQEPGKMRSVAGIGLTGNTPTDIFLDENDRPLMRGISWQDTRAVEEAEEIKAQFPPDRMRELLGHDMIVTASWSASRYRWFTKHCPDLAARCKQISYPWNYVGLRMTGAHISDPWNLRSTLNLQTGEQSRELLDFLGLRPEQFPRAASVQTKIGGLTAQAARELGLCEGIPVANGCGDALATMLGSGVLLDAGVAFNSAGTSEIVGMSVPGAPIVMKGMMTVPHNVTETYSIVYGPTQSGSGSLVWLLRNLLGRDDLQAAFREAESVPAGSDGLLFLPYLSGERAPLWEPRVRGSFTGLSSTHTAAHLIRATMEGVAFSVRHCLDLAEKQYRVTPKVIRISGGGSKTPLWMQIKANVIGVPVETLACENACALGAAMTAAVAIGLYPGFAEASAHMVRVKDRINPDPTVRAIYQSAFRRYLFDSAAALERMEK